MKKWIVTAVSALLFAMLMTMQAWCFEIGYVDRDQTNVYEKKDINSKVLRVLKGGDQVWLEERINDNWYRCTIAIPGKDGQYEGFVAAKHISLFMPSRYCKHEWTNWETYTEPTCTTTGLKTRSCPKCGIGESQEIPALGHNYGNWTVTKGATCTQEGAQVRRCSRCGHEDVQVIPKAPHAFGSWNEIRKATCSEEGQISHTCTVCGYVETQAVEKLPHTFGDWIITKEATDHSAGTRTRECQVCGYREPEESFDPEGTVRRGDRSDEAAHVQQLLADQNYLNKDGVDGIFGGGTETAVMKFQSDKGLTPDGVVWPQTLKLLEHEFGPWETVTPLTREEAGERKRTCKECGFEQHETLELTPVIERGNRGEAVRAIQQMLGSMEYEVGNYDGIYGPKLDNAYSEFAKANEIEFEEGKLLPAHIDLLMNAWIEKVDEKEWMMHDPETNAPVVPALTVTLAEDEEDKAENSDDITVYKWSLTNPGEEGCTFAALLLNFDKDPDFKKDNFVVVIDGEQLEANCQNSASGTIKVSKEWGKGTPSFCALTVAEESGIKWLSNVVTIEE